VYDRPDKVARAAIVGYFMMCWIQLENRVRVTGAHIVYSHPTTSSYIPTTCTFSHRVISSSSQPSSKSMQTAAPQPRCCLDIRTLPRKAYSFPLLMLRNTGILCVSSYNLINCRKATQPEGFSLNFIRLSVCSMCNKPQGRPVDHELSLLEPRRVETNNNVFFLEG
jgi:hypothetical protein